MYSNLKGLLCILILPFLAGGCSVKRAAIDSLADSLASGGSVFARDDDPELVRDAAPFSLKLMESILAESPEHEGLLLSLCSGFTQYAYGFVHLEANRSALYDYDKSISLKFRARRLYLRARDYGIRGLEARHPGIELTLHENPFHAVENTTREDVPFLYWTAVSWAGAISVSKDDPNLIGQIPQVEALIERALKLDESFLNGAIHDFLITFEMSQSRALNENIEAARKHYSRAVELSGGQTASPMVSLAEAVCIQTQNVGEFRRVLNEALVIDPDLRKDLRLANVLNQNYARWLLDSIGEFFLMPEGVEP